MSAISDELERIIQGGLRRVVNGELDEWGRYREAGPRATLTPAQRRHYDLAQPGAQLDFDFHMERSIARRLTTRR